jgi:hypothetical protein
MDIPQFLMGIEILNNDGIRCHLDDLGSANHVVTGVGM